MRTSGRRACFCLTEKFIMKLMLKNKNFDHAANGHDPFVVHIHTVVEQNGFGNLISDRSHLPLIRRVLIATAAANLR